MIAILRRRKLGFVSCKEIAARCNSAVKVIRNDNIGDVGGIDLLIRWGCTSQIGVKNVLNTVDAIHKVNNKLEFRKVLEENELCPQTWFSIEQALEVLMPDANGKFTLQGKGGEHRVVVRPERHAQGRHLYVCGTVNELKEACRKCGNGYYISALINKVAEYRVFCVQGRVACVAKKTPGNPDQVAWNVAQGGRFDNVRWDDWPLRAVKAGIKAFDLSGLDFGGVDVMVDADGEAYILEINSAPSLTSDYRQDCMAKCFDYIAEHGKGKIEMVEARGGYRKFIHPAVSDRAIVKGVN